MKLYHGTSKHNAELIFNQGFKDMSWFTTNKLRAKVFGIKKQDKSNVLLLVEIRKDIVDNKKCYTVEQKGPVKYTAIDYCLITDKPTNKNIFKTSIEKLTSTENRFVRRAYNKELENRK